MNGLFKKLNQSKIFKDLTPEEFSWVLYDVGNSAFTMLACSLVPVWFSNLVLATGANQLTATSMWGYVQAGVTVILVLVGPALGAIADHKDTRKILFQSAVFIGVTMCIITGFAWNWVVFTLMYMLTRLFYSASLTFYDSMLNDVTTDERSDAVSAYGYAWGYIGSCIPFTLSLACAALGPLMLNIISESLSKILAFAITGCWWLMVTMPLLKNYKQINYVEGKPHIAAAFKKILTTIGRIIRQDKKVFFFLLAFFLYIDGVGTIIDNCVTIGKAVGLNNDILLIIFLLLTQVVAWIGSLVFARLSKKYKTITLLSVCIGGYFVGSLYGLFINTMLDFAILAFIVGCFQGSIQSLSRSYYSRIIPDENSGEYFGLYDIFSKGASVFGSLVIGIVTAKGDPETGKMALNLFGKAFEVGSINLAVAMLCIFFLLGFILLRIADRFPQSDASKGDIQ